MKKRLEKQRGSSVNHLASPFAAMNGFHARSSLEKPKRECRLVDSLTFVEVSTRNDPKILYPLADGHADQVDARYWKEAIELLPTFEKAAAKMRDREAELLFRERSMDLFGQSGADDDINFRVLPNASLAIDVAMTMCARRGWNVLLLQPVFDNLALYAKERGVDVSPLDEAALRQYGADAVDTVTADVVFLVSPNNPTGLTLDEGTLTAIAEKCARDRTTLAIDASFRAYDTFGADHYAVLREAGCSWIVIEDTGKVLPTAERKASIISCSNDLKADINQICELHVLGWSRPILVMLAHLFGHFQAVGLEEAIHGRIRLARGLVRKAVAGTFVRPAPIAIDSTLPVEWLEILDDRYDDLAIAECLAQQGLGVLPGRHFYWAGNDEANRRFIRISLLKDEALVKKAAERLRSALLNNCEPLGAEEVRYVG